MADIFLHEHTEFKDLIENTSAKHLIDDPFLCEKDYWIMHCLYALSALGLTFELKGGTSLSKGYGAIDRFSEDIDLRIDPDEKLTGFKVYAGKNQDDQKHRDSRKNYFDWIAEYLKGKINGVVEVTRDHSFDDPNKFRNGGIRLKYKSNFDQIAALKDGILLEVGFDRTAPNEKKLISSWAYDFAKEMSGTSFKDNRAVGVPCYEPKYTFVEKLQAISTKHRLYKEQKGSRTLPANFIRHYYDLYQLLSRKDVSDFIGTPEYIDYKKERFRSEETDLSKSSAIYLSDDDLEIFSKEYNDTSALYFRSRPSFKEIIERLKQNAARL